MSHKKYDLRLFLSGKEVGSMAQIFRVERTKNFTVMSNHHFKNKNLTLKAKGLLSLMLSLENEFNGNYERKRAEAEQTAGADEELIGYYRQVEAACEGTGGNTGESDGREGRVAGEKSEDERVYPGIPGTDTQVENGKTEAILRESQAARRNAEVERRNSADDSRIVRNAETQSVLTAKQRRLEEQKRIDEQERARATRRRNKRRSGPEL